MLTTYQYPKFTYRRPAELDQDTRRRAPVVVIGAGPVGMGAAIDLAQYGVPVILLDDDDTVSIGSRGVCYAKRALEVLDRLGVGDPVCDKGVSWNVGRTFFRQEEVYNFNLCPEPDHKRPGMINLQQYYLEEYMVKRIEELPLIDLRWKNKVVGVEPQGAGAAIKIETPDGTYQLETDWLIVGDGARSPIRHMLGLEIDGKIFQDRFLIADVVMEADFPAERWFWFDPPFHPGQSVLLHRQADNVWRIDFQLGWASDPEEEKKPERVIPRLKAMLGEDRPFELEWVSIYTFQCRRMPSFRHGRIFFIGDAAHQVSPFGARGANSGFQDTDNLVWKLKLVMDGKAPESLLDTYGEERQHGADENIMNSTRSTDFITPKSPLSLTFRNATLALARTFPFARDLVNSGRLSVPCYLDGSSLTTPDQDLFGGGMVPGAPMDDAPVALSDGTETWLLDQVRDRFVLLASGGDLAPTVAAAAELAAADIPVTVMAVVKPGEAAPAGVAALVDVRNRFTERYDAASGAVYLIRPDQHVAARWRRFDGSAVKAALARAVGLAA